MKAIIDLLMLGIIVICTWSGYKKGIIMGVGGILCIIISIYGANLLAVSFSGDVVPALKPFASGYTEGIVNAEDSEIMKNMGWEDEELSVEDLIQREPGSRQAFGAECYMALGIDEGTSGRLAQLAVEYEESNPGTSMLDSVTQILCEKVSYVACFTLAFLLIIIVLTVLGNIPNLSFRIPGADLVNDIGGALLGLATGFMFCALLVWALKFLGMIIGSDTLGRTVLGSWLVEKDFLFKYLGV